MKYAKFYKAMSGYWAVEYSIKGESKPRRRSLGSSEEKELEDTMERFKQKGYTVTLVRYDK